MIKNRFNSEPIEVAIDIPSGCIVFADDLRWVYDVPDDKGSPRNAHGPLWQKIITKAYGKAGLFHGYVGNSCPSIHLYRNKIIIGNPSYDKENWETMDDLPGKPMGSICTDLWWYSLADKTQFQQLLESKGGNIDKINFDGTLEVEPGRYILRHYYPYFGKPTIKYNEGVKIYAILERSNKEVIDQKLPDEGVADMMMALSDVDFAWVEADEDKIDEINKDESLIFEYYQLKTHWKSTEIGDIFTTVKFTREELQDHELVMRRSIEHRKVAFEKDLKHKRDMEILKKNIELMSPEEKEAHNKRMRKMTDEILAELKAERN